MSGWGSPTGRRRKPGSGGFQDPSKNDLPRTGAIRSKKKIGEVKKNRNVLIAGSGELFRSRHVLVAALKGYGFTVDVRATSAIYADEATPVLSTHRQDELQDLLAGSALNIVMLSGTEDKGPSTLHLEQLFLLHARSAPAILGIAADTACAMMEVVTERHAQIAFALAYPCFLHTLRGKGFGMRFFDAEILTDAQKQCKIGEIVSAIAEYIIH